MMIDPLADDDDEAASAFVTSKIRYVQDNEEDNGKQWRQGHLMALLPLSRKNANNERMLQEFRVYVELSAFLAFKHIQHRSGMVLLDIPRRLADCDFRWTYMHHDTQFSPLQAAREVLTYQLPELNQPRNYTWIKPTPPQPAASNISTTDDNDNEYWTLPEHVTQQQQQQQQHQQQSINDTVEATSSNSALVLNNSNTSSNSIPPSVDPSPRTAPPRELPQRTAFPLRPTTTDAPYVLPPRGGGGSRKKKRQRRHLQSTNRDNNNNHRSGNDDADTTTQQQPFAILGAARSVVSSAVGILGSAFDLPQISSSSTASSLDDLPFFSRTVPTNQGDAHATIVYLSQTLKVSHVGVLHLDDSWGRRYEQDLQFYANRYGIEVKSVAYNTNTPESLQQAIMQLSQLELRYYVGILNPSAWKPVIRKAYDFGLIGQPHITWFIADLVELVGDGFALDRETESDIAKALHGTGVVFLQVTPHKMFDRALALVAENPQLQQEFIASHSDPELFENFTFSPNPGMSLFQYLTYDAIVALGITACETPGLFTGREFYDQLLKIDFQGVSGRVNLQETTGTRLGDSLQYQIVNMVLDDYLPEQEEPTRTTTTSPPSSTTTMSFAADVSSLIELSPQSDNGTILPPAVHSVKPFVYFDNTTIPPPALPYLEENLNLIPDGVLYFGLTLSIMVMLLSVAIAVWVYLNQKRYVIRASQPFFMMQLCAGTLILAATIIPMGWQEPKKGLDAACMTTPWLFSIGFSVAISALFGKARRINQLIGVGTGFRRCKVKPQDVMKPFFFLMGVNVVLLTAWSASPWRISWHRITVSNNVDQFGRIQESYGVCRADGVWHFIFSVPLVTTNVLFLGLATWQSYRARALPSELSETSYLAISMVSLTETFWLGLTIVFTVMSHPTSFYLVSSIMITVGCMAILGPMFGPKFVNRNMKEPRGRLAASVVLGRPGRSRMISGLHNNASSNFGSANGFRVTRSGTFRNISRNGGSSSSWMNNSGFIHGGGSSARRSANGSLSSGTFHGTTRRSNEDISPFGSSSSQQLRATTEHVRARTSSGTTLHTHEEEDKSNKSFSDHSFE